MGDAVGGLGGYWEGHRPARATEGAAVSKHEALPADEGADRHAAGEAPERRPGSSDRRVQIAAARLRVVLDERLNRPTPEWVKRLAEQKLAS
jgi:hypothetical protein